MTNSLSNSKSLSDNQWLDAILSINISESLRKADFNPKHASRVPNTLIIIETEDLEVAFRSRDIRLVERTRSKERKIRVVLNSGEMFTFSCYLFDVQLKIYHAILRTMGLRPSTTLKRKYLFKESRS